MTTTPLSVLPIASLCHLPSAAETSSHLASCRDFPTLNTQARLWRPWERFDLGTSHSSQGLPPGRSPPSPEAGAHPTNPFLQVPRLEGTTGCGESGQPRCSESWVGGRNQQRAGGDGSSRPEETTVEDWGQWLQTPHHKTVGSLVRLHSLTSPVHAAAHGCCWRSFYDEGYRVTCL